jgi:mannose-6-phosphate isomerase-like protein (cupin superfamily)
MALGSMNRRRKAMAGYVGPLERQTLANRDFRRVLFTGKHLQLVLMCLGPGEEIGTEVHGDVDQFFRVEEGTALFVLRGRGTQRVGDGGALVVPAGTRHNVVNASKRKPLRLYTIYSPPNHPPRTVHRTRADAMAAEHEHT